MKGTMMTDYKTLETTHGNSAIMPWHIGAHVVFCLGEHTNIRLFRNDMLLFIKTIENRNSGELICPRDYPDKDTVFVFKHEDNSLTIRYEGSQATFSNVGVSQLLDQLKRTSARRDNEWRLPDDMYPFAIGDKLMATEAFVLDNQYIGIFVGDLLQLQMVRGATFTVFSIGGLTINTTAEMVNEMRRMYTDSTGSDELDELWDNWDCPGD